MAKDKSEKKADKGDDIKSDPPIEKKKDEKKVTKEEPKMLHVNENSSVGVFILLVGLNVFACALLKHHFANVLSELDGAISELEQNTNILYHAWGPDTIQNAKAMYDQSKTWTDELVANVTGTQTEALIKRVQTGQEHAEKKMVEMELMLKRYKSGEPIFDFEGSLKNDTFKPADIKQKYKIVYANGTEETDHSLINIAKNAIIDLKTKYHTIERKIKHQRKQIETQIYAYQQVESKKLFDHGVKFIEENTKMILELPEKYDFDMLKTEYQGLNKTAQGVKDDLTLIEYSLNLVSDMKSGNVPDLSTMRERISTLRADLKGMRPFLIAMKRKSQDSVSGSIAAEKYMEEIKHILEYHEVEYLWPKYQELKKKINLEVRTKYDKYNRLVSQYQPVCTGRMGEETSKELIEVQKARESLHDKLEAYGAAFPDFEVWLKEFHGECQEYIKETEVLIDELIEKVSGPVAKATRILHKRKNTLHHENQLFYRLKEGKFKASDEDFKSQIERFDEMDYPRQIQLVRDIIQAQEVRLSKTLPGSEELTDEEMGVINELADHEQASNYASAQRGREEAEERAAKELMEELRKLQEM